jgi:hypothetical protein
MLIKGQNSLIFHLNRVVNFLRPKYSLFILMEHYIDSIVQARSALDPFAVDFAEREATLTTASGNYAGHLAVADRSMLLGHARNVRRLSRSDDPIQSYAARIELRGIEPHLEERGRRDDLVFA